MSNDITTRLRRDCMSLIADEAADTIERLRADVMCLKYQNAEFVRNLTMAQDERNTAVAERDEVRQSYCSLMEAYRGGDGRVTANKLGWGYLFEEDKPCQ